MKILLWVIDFFFTMSCLFISKNLRKYKLTSIEIIFINLPDTDSFASTWVKDLIGPMYPKQRVGPIVLTKNTCMKDMAVRRDKVQSYYFFLSSLLSHFKCCVSLSILPSCCSHWKRKKKYGTHTISTCLIVHHCRAKWHGIGDINVEITLLVDRCENKWFGWVEAFFLNLQYKTL